MERINLSGRLLRRGVYTVKSGYRSLSDEVNSLAMIPTSSYNHSPEAWVNIWSAGVPEKIKQFVWRIKQNAMAAKSNLFRKRISRDHICPV